MRQVAALHIEPLHLLVKPELYAAVQQNLLNLQGKTINLSNPGSGTHDLALEVLRFAGLKEPSAAGPGDYFASLQTYQELEKQIDHGTLPDAILTLSSLPSPVPRHLVAHRHYKLVSLPFAEAFSLESFENDVDQRGSLDSDKRARVDRSKIYPTAIPAFTYGVEPPCPPAPLPTFGPRLLLVAHESVPKEAVRLLLESVYSAEFAQFYRPPLDPGLLDLAPEFPWHLGALEYRRDRQPLLAGDVIDLLNKSTSIAGALAGALFFLWQWLRQYYRRRRESGFESYMIKVADIETKALELEHRAILDLKVLLELRVELNRLKNEALARFAEGKLEGEALISGFIAHVNDARYYLTRLILHERNNFENRAQAENRSTHELWRETIGEVPEEIDSSSARRGS